LRNLKHNARRARNEFGIAVVVVVDAEKTQFSVDLDLVKKKMTLICRKHFVGGKGRITDHPDPFPAIAFPEGSA